MHELPQGYVLDRSCGRDQSRPGKHSTFGKNFVVGVVT